MFRAALVAVLLIGSAVPAAAAPAETFEETIPFAAVLTDCGTEPVAIVATIHLVSSIRTGDAGFDVKMHATTRGTGLGLVTSAPYAVIGKEHFDFGVDTADIDLHLVFDLKLLGQGKAPNSTLYVRMRVVVRNGVLRAEHERAGCRIN